LVEELDYAVDEARRILADLEGTSSVDILVGNRISPVEILSPSRFRRQYARDKSEQEALRDYWRHLESVRLVTNNVLPHINYLCLLRLIQMRVAKNVITTNYDGFIPSVLNRIEKPPPWAFNPCWGLDAEPELGDCDGYLTHGSERTATALWTIHGNLEFVRTLRCGHLLRLPRFIVDHVDIETDFIQALRSNGISLVHYALSLPNDGRADGTGSLHAGLEYAHHIDFGASRATFFQKERRAAKNSLRSQSTRAVLILGLSMNPRYPEDLEDTLVDVARRGVPLIYIMPSIAELTEKDSALKFRLDREALPYILINENNPEAEIQDSLVRLLEGLGQTDLYEEYRQWEASGKWWVEDEAV
jgi:hypothetical protein